MKYRKHGQGVTAETTCDYSVNCLNLPKAERKLTC